MSDTTTFDYYYGDESSQFSFYRIPRQLITGEQFKRLSTDAKLLYGLLLDRMGLSAKNGWYDDLGRVYIYYTLYEIQEDLNCGHDKAVKLLSELDTGKGFGLIERVKQGQGKPAKVYVKRFTTRAVPPSPPEPEQELPPRLPIIGSADFGKSAGNYNKSIQTDSIQLDPSIHPSPSPPCGAVMDRYDCRREVEESVDYEILCGRYGHEDMDEVVELITDVLCSNRSTYRIGGEDLPIAQVKDRFYKLDCGTEKRQIRGPVCRGQGNAATADRRRHTVRRRGHGGDAGSNRHAGLCVSGRKPEKVGHAHAVAEKGG